MRRKNLIRSRSASIPKHLTWAEHREALRREAEENRERRLLVQK